MKQNLILLLVLTIALFCVACASTKSYEDGYYAGYQDGLNSLNSTDGDNVGYQTEANSTASTTESVDFDEWYKEWSKDKTSFSEILEKYREAETGLALQPEPASGTILSGIEYNNGSKITVTAAYQSACVVKLKNSVGTTRLSFYVRAGDTVTIGVPAAFLYVYFASGDTWYGEEHLFGDNTYYSKDKNLLDFTNYSWEYTLYSTYNGNFTETPIDAEEFK